MDVSLAWKLHTQLDVMSPTHSNCLQGPLGPVMINFESYPLHFVLGLPAVGSGSLTGTHLHAGPQGKTHVQETMND